jgi:DNA-binding NarL/FixJ family response regulator
MSARHLSPIRIAVLEDHQPMREGLTRLLSAAGMWVAAASGDPQELVRQLESLPADVVLMELTRGGPRVNGPGPSLRALSLLGWKLPASRPIVFSSLSSPRLIARCACFGARAFLCKRETGPGALLEAVKAVAKGVGAASGRARAENQPSLTPLTPREHQVLGLVTEGLDNALIATILRVSESTVKCFMAALYRKLAAGTRVELALLVDEVDL